MRPEVCPDLRGLRLHSAFFSIFIFICPEVCPDLRGLRLRAPRNSSIALKKSGSLPRFEGIETDRSRSLVLLHWCPEVCPDLRGLRQGGRRPQHPTPDCPEVCPDLRGLRLVNELVECSRNVRPEVCPDLRGLRLFASNEKNYWKFQSGSLPRFEGIETHIIIPFTIVDDWVRKFAPI